MDLPGSFELQVAPLDGVLRALDQQASGVCEDLVREGRDTERISWPHVSGEAMIAAMVSKFSAWRRLRVPKSPQTSGAIQS